MAESNRPSHNLMRNRCGAFGLHTQAIIDISGYRDSEPIVQIGKVKL
jgi:hypothetical protein